ncbi:MAG: hypothetical protein ABI132_06135 [Rhodanobacteraceae bacterium]
MSTPIPNSIIIPVTVDDTTDPWNLLVNGNRSSNQTDVGNNSLKQTLEWNLQLAAGQTGSFNPINETETSGFSWTCTPKPGANIFSGYSEPSTQNGTQIQVNDLASGASAKGTWTYKLRATVNGNPCETNPPSARGQEGDPKIHNK